MEHRSCTGAIDGEYLARYRVAVPGGLDYFAKPMTLDQISERRIFLRKALAPYPPWEGMTNEQLNQIRIYRVEGGYLAEDIDGRPYFLPDGRVTKEETDFRRMRSMMPFEFLTSGVRDFDWTKYKEDVSQQKQLVNEYILKYPQFSKRGMGLYIFSGTKGSGKTMLSCCLVNEISRRYKGSVKFVNILDFLEMTKKEFQGYEKDVNVLHNAGLLVLDDIGIQMSKEWIDTVLYRLVNDRYVNRLPTIYTSNLALDTLRVDDRITDRIEAGTFQVKLPEESVRRSMRQQEKQKLLEEITNAP